MPASEPQRHQNMRILSILFIAPLVGWGQGIITTVAGSGNGHDFPKSSGNGGPATSATLNPNGVAVDGAGNIYIADRGSSSIRKVNPAGIISLFAGGGGHGLGDGKPAVDCLLYMQALHNGVAIDKAGNVYIADNGNARIRKVDTSGIITTVAGNGRHAFSGDGGPATKASLWSPSDVALDSAGNIYIADQMNYRIRKVDTNGIITTVAGNGGFQASGDGGPATSASLVIPMSVTVDRAGNIYIGDRGSQTVRKVNTSGIITTVAGGGPFPFSGDGGPAIGAGITVCDVAVDTSGNIYIADCGAFRVRKVDTSGTINTIAGMGEAIILGDEGPPTEAGLDPFGVALDSSGNYYIADQEFERIRKVTGGIVRQAPSIAATGLVNGASFVSGGIVPGEIATVFGTDLTSSSGINLTSGLPLVTTFLDASVVVNGKAAPLFAIDNVNGQQQINFQVPWEVGGESTATIAVTSGGASSSTVVVPVLAAQPGIIYYSAAGGNFGVILHSDYQLADSAHPVKAGETLLIYCTGLGSVSSPPADGAAANGQTTLVMPKVTIGAANAPVSFSGLAPDFVGLNQLNVQVPSGLEAGNQAVVITSGGVSSNSVLVPVE